MYKRLKSIKERTLKNKESKSNWITIIGVFSQLGLLIVAVVTVLLTVVPLYQKELLQEKVAVVERDLLIKNEEYNKILDDTQNKEKELNMLTLDLISKDDELFNKELQLQEFDEKILKFRYIYELQKKYFSYNLHDIVFRYLESNDKAIQIPVFNQSIILETVTAEILNQDEIIENEKDYFIDLYNELNPVINSFEICNEIEKLKNEYYSRINEHISNKKEENNSEFNNIDLIKIKVELRGEYIPKIMEIVENFEKTYEILLKELE